jgi:excinuclease ABC subunit A
MDVIKTADWVIDLGPEGGDNGGRVVASGPPEKIAQNNKSHTGRFLKAYLKGSGRLKRKKSGPGGVAETISGLSPLQPSGNITLKGAREHNLKDIDLAIPQNELVVLTGVSGSGKSTLAFDILFAEGQRRYLESLAPYVRQYMKILERPDVDLVTAIHGGDPHRNLSFPQAVIQQTGQPALSRMRTPADRPNPGGHRQTDPQTLFEKSRHCAGNQGFRPQRIS